MEGNTSLNTLEYRMFCIGAYFTYSSPCMNRHLYVVFETSHLDCELKEATYETLDWYTYTNLHILTSYYFRKIGSMCICSRLSYRKLHDYNDFRIRKIHIFEIKIFVLFHIEMLKILTL